MKRVFVLLLAAVMCLSVIVCGGSAFAASAADTFKIAIVTHLTGQNVVLGNRQVHACKLAQKIINDNGGVNGKQLELVYFDCGESQQDCINAVQLACNTEGISGIVNSFFSQNCIATSDIVKEAKIPTINLGSSKNLNDVCMDNDYYWMIRLTDKIANSSTADAAIAKGVTNPALIYMTNASGQTQFAAMTARYKEKGYDPKIAIAFDNQATVDYQALVGQAINSDADGAILIMATEEAPGFISLFKQQNYGKPVAAVPSAFSTDVIDVIGDQVDGVFGTCEFNGSSDRKIVVDYCAAFRKQSNNEMSSAWQDAVTYDSIFLLCEAAKSSGGSDPKSVQAGLSKIKNHDGVLCNLSYHDDKTFATEMYECVYSGTTIKIGAAFNPRS